MFREVHLKRQVRSLLSFSRLHVTETTNADQDGASSHPEPPDRTALLDVTPLDNSPARPSNPALQHLHK